jgi:hypothetical protein
MLSDRLVQTIENHWELIAQRAIDAVHRDPEVPNYQSLTDDELRERARHLLSNLGQWLASRDESLISRRYEALGRQRCEEGMPLHEVIYKLQLLKRMVLEQARDAHLEMNALQLYSEQEFLTSVDGFFDRIIYRVAKGFSESLMANSYAGQNTQKHDAWV